MENFVIESANKKILVNNVELDLLFDDNEFARKMKDLFDAIEKSEGMSDLDSMPIISKAIDDLFGKGTCMKLFNTNTPANHIGRQFLDYLMDFFKEFYDTRYKKIEEKYGAERLGE